MKKRKCEREEETSLRRNQRGNGGHKEVEEEGDAGDAGDAGGTQLTFLQDSADCKHTL